MPLDWQTQFVALMDELELATSKLPDLPSTYDVQTRDEQGHYIKDSYKDYGRGRRVVPLLTTADIMPDVDTKSSGIYKGYKWSCHRTLPNDADILEIIHIPDDIFESLMIGYQWGQIASHPLEQYKTGYFTPHTFMHAGRWLTFERIGRVNQGRRTRAFIDTLLATPTVS